MLKKRASRQSSLRVQIQDTPHASASAPSGGDRSDSGGVPAVPISADDLYWLANEQHRLSLKRNAIYRILSRLSAARRGGGARGMAELGRESAGAVVAGAIEPSEPITSDRAFYLGYAPRSVRAAPPSVSGELIGRHACEVLGSQACHACTAEAARLRSQAVLGGGVGATGAFSAVTIAKATKLKKLLADDRPLRMLQEQIERGEIASGSFLSSRNDRMAAAAAADTTELRRRLDGGDDDSVAGRARAAAAAAASAAALAASIAAERGDRGRTDGHPRPPRDRRTLFFADLKDLRDKIRFGVIPSAVVPSEDTELMSSLRRLRPVDDEAMATASESFQRIYYAPPLLTVEQQNVQSTFFAGCSAKYSLPPPLPDSIVAAPAAAATASAPSGVAALPSQ